MKVLPRHFAADGPSERLADAPRLAVALVDAFDVRDAGGPSPGVVVTADGDGALALWAGCRVRELPAEVQAALAAHTVGAPVRQVAVQQLYLMAAEDLAIGADRPGLDDPIRLGGVLYGPFLGSGAEPAATRGHLVVTLLDCLAGLVHGLPFASAHDVDGRPEAAACVGALLPSSDLEAVRRGEGMVLVYPWSRAAPLSQGNEAVVGAWVQRLLSALRAEMIRSGVRGGWLRRPLPLAAVQRAALEADLRARGFEVRDDVALRGRSGFWGLFLRDAVALPRVAGARELMAVAAEALDGVLAGALDRVNAARERTRGWSVLWTPSLRTGLAPVRAEDGDFDLKRDCIASRWASSGRFEYLHFRAQGALAVDGGDLQLDVELRGYGGRVVCQYAAAGPVVLEPYRPCPNTESLDRGGWRAVRFSLSSAVLCGAQTGGADLRLAVSGGLVEVRRLVLTARPAPIDVGEMQPSAGASFTYRGSGTRLCAADSTQDARASCLRVLEDGRPIGPGHCAPSDIAEGGGGRFRHWTDGNGAPCLWFSASDGSDPRTNGRSYALIVRR